MSADELGEVLFSADQITARVGSSRGDLRDYAGRDLVLAGVSVGPPFSSSTSPGDLHPPSPSTSSRFQLRAKQQGLGRRPYREGPGEEIAGRDLLVVEDIVDTGLTLGYLLRILRERGPSSLKVCTLLDRNVRRIVDSPIAYRGFVVPDNSSSDMDSITTSATGISPSSPRSSLLVTPGATRWGRRARRFSSAVSHSKRCGRVSRDEGGLRRGESRRRRTAGGQWLLPRSSAGRSDRPGDQP